MYLKGQEIKFQFHISDFFFFSYDYITSSINLERGPHAVVVNMLDCYKWVQIPVGFFV